MPANQEPELNRLKQIIAEKGNAVGTFLGVANVPIVEAMAHTGLDFVVVDTEHGPYDTENMSDLIRTAEQSGLAPLVRVADVTHKEIQRAVDNGAQGIIVPCLRDAEDFREAVRLAKFAPIGTRGFIKGRGSGFGSAPWASGSLEEYMEKSNERVLVLPQCETEEALEQIEEIVEIEGLDGIFIGPFDLSICMGIPAQFEHPDFKAALDRILLACRKAGKLCLIFGSDPDESRRYLEMGFDAVADSIDAIVFTEAYRAIVRDIRG